MTVKELKEFLENLPDDAECFSYESHCSYTGQVYWEPTNVSFNAEFKEVRFQ